MECAGYLQDQRPSVKDYFQPPCQALGITATHGRMDFARERAAALAKNILIFADGTGNEGGLLPDESRTNVYKLFRATRTDPDSIIDPAKQQAFYVYGIGTTGPSHASFWQKRTQVLAQMFGNGLAHRIALCYVAILSLWKPGDRIYLFGFSRGAYTVRCLANLLEAVGIPTKVGGSDISLDHKSLYRIARSAVRVRYRFGLLRKSIKEREQLAQVFVAQHACHVGAEIGATPYFIGVWDTVAAIGWGRWLRNRYDLHLPRDIKFARHAMAIDEYRKDFARVGWGGRATVRPKVEGEPDPVQQIWFAGNHSDIGGSYPENESRLSDISLKWMVDFITTEIPEAFRVHINLDRMHLFPSCEGMMHDECMVGLAGTPLHWYPADRDVPRQAILHKSVLERLNLPSVRNFKSFGPYRPAPLREHEKCKALYPQSSDTSPPTHQ
ncbi:MAG: hypothetical protein QOF41_3057 [Methylobacteriaceae bacterium]|nr:hypothetical protein [Methylobacteriaceae bacterium]